MFIFLYLIIGVCFLAVQTRFFLVFFSPPACCSLLWPAMESIQVASQLPAPMACSCSLLLLAHRSALVAALIATALFLLLRRCLLECEDVVPVPCIEGSLEPHRRHLRRPALCEEV